MTTAVSVYPGETMLRQHQTAMVAHMMREPGMLLDYATAAVGNLWSRLTHHIRADHPELPDGYEYRIMSEAIGYLTLSAHDASFAYVPSELVDIGWHTFVPYTYEYAAFCDSVAGRFIHHVPWDVPGLNPADKMPAGSVRAGHFYCAQSCDCGSGGNSGGKMKFIDQTADCLAMFWPVDRELWQDTRVRKDCNALGVQF